MAEELLLEYFPSIEGEFLQYVTGVLEDFEGSSDDLYDSIGGILLEMDTNATEEGITAICNKIHHILDLDEGKDVEHKKLEAPVMFGERLGEGKSAGEDMSIWLTKKDENKTIVNQSRLAKAEEKIKQKQQRRAEKDGAAGPRVIEMGDASASQQINRQDNKADATGSHLVQDIRIENFDVSFGAQQLIKGATMVMNFGRRYGFVGRNGRGKSTLLRMLSSGSLKIPSHLRLLHVEQEVVGDDTLAVESVLECDTKRTALLTEEKELNAILSTGESNSKANSRLAEVYHELETIEADKAPSRAAVILNGLGFTPEMQGWTTKKFSGGWRMRLALARALFAKPDLLLLDEPTNMLDMKAIIWLENYLQDWPTTLLVVSHDRSFLNSVSTDIFYLTNTQSIEHYRGNYDNFEKTYEELTRNKIREYEAQTQLREHAQKFIDKFRYNAKRASLVQSKIKMLEKLPELTPVVRESEVTLRFPETEPLQGTILQLDEASFRYSPESPHVFVNVDLSANETSRICIVGENGAGKTTLLKILRGELVPTKGIRHAHRNLAIGYFTQHHVDQMSMDLAAVELIAQKIPGQKIEQYRNILGRFGCSADLAVRPLMSLSGGQKSRVAFAAMCVTNPNFLILDEPTNHLDVETVEALGRALNQFKGGVILVSHDERLIRVVCSELWVASNQTVRAMQGGIDEYRKLVEKELQL
ncbi:ATP-binding cassette sub-family F member 3-like [Watersipora subatra]|uniref:ATP-binding cassette sub-family F member 3-like n=1 Tax=Watersipora subatra TaxID=2589382 RepID=UPI00355B6B31